MKHTMKITLFLIIIFLLSQIIGLAIVNEYIDIKQTSETGKTVVNAEIYSISGIQPPEVANESFSWIFIMISVLIGTVLILIIIRFKQKKVWKAWFLIAIFFCLRYAFAPFIKRFIALFPSTPIAYATWITIIIAFCFALYKVFWPNIYVHNFTELFIYGGLAAIIVPIINLTSAFFLLLAISLYDMFAVWQSKHMVKMAQYQTENKMFAGLILNYKKDADNNQERKVRLKVIKAPIAAKKAMPAPAKKEESYEKDNETKTAILGGGDVAFPLLFAGVVMKTTGSYLAPAIIVATTTVALFLLLYYAEKDKFYPAMPFISTGCFAGYVVTMLL
jgi:presenilin-like A22 family membrane protease